MLSNTLNTNELKNAAGAEVEFDHQESDARHRVFKAIPENPAFPHLLSVNHQEVGVGIKRVRRSNVRIDKTVVSGVDNTTPVPISAYTVVSIPVGALVNMTEVTNVLAELQSFISTTGAGTTVLFDGSGNGAKCLLGGSL
jgi:hypothetical protein